VSIGIGLRIYRLDTLPNPWTNIFGWNWPISALSYNRAIGLGAGGVKGVNHIYQFNPNFFSPADKADQYGQNIENAIWVGMGDVEESWYIDTVNNIYRFNKTSKKWDDKTNNIIGCSLDVQCANRVVMTSTCGKSYILGDDQNWTQLPFTNVKFTTANYKTVYAVTKDNKVLAWTPADGTYVCGCAEGCPEWVTK